MSNMNYGPSDDVKVIEVSETTLPGGLHVDRMTFDVHGHIVQITSYDKSEHVITRIDDNVAQHMHISDVDTFIRNRT